MATDAEDAEVEDVVDYRVLLNDPENHPTLSRGIKRFAPSGDTAEDPVLEESRTALYLVLKEERRTSPTSQSTAVFEPHSNLIELVLIRGGFLKSVGHSVGARTYLYPEEALFLLDRSALTIKHYGTPVSVMQAYDLLIGKADCTMETYLVYAFLKRLGYTVFRAQHVAPAQPFIPQQDGVLSRVSLTFRTYFGFLFRAIRTLLFPFYRKHEHWPLIHIPSITSAPMLFRRLQIISRVSASPAFHVGKPYQAVFDVYKPRAQFRKSAPGIPDFRVMVHTPEVPMPDLHSFRAWLDGGVPVKVAVVDAGNVSFLGFSGVDGGPMGFMR
ncbi:tRNA-splicing endonuclease subunit sen54 [Gaertneriomyces sp. JEL0708]|nr:tRNA-splicing endonuclease subunit sen54 [Gaertneriomyces sp. JEL0708]